MARRRLKFRDLKRILASYGVGADESAGKGSHVKFYKTFPDGRFTYPVPPNPDVLPCYVNGCRKKFRLRPQDGVSDDEFFSR